MRHHGEKTRRRRIGRSGRQIWNHRWASSTIRKLAAVFVQSCQLSTGRRRLPRAVLRPRFQSWPVACRCSVLFLWKPCEYCKGGHWSQQTAGRTWCQQQCGFVSNSETWSSRTTKQVILQFSAYWGRILSGTMNFRLHSDHSTLGGMLCQHASPSTRFGPYNSRETDVGVVLRNKALVCSQIEMQASEERMVARRHWTQERGLELIVTRKAASKPSRRRDVWFRRWSRKQLVFQWRF